MRPVKAVFILLLFCLTVHSSSQATYLPSTIGSIQAVQSLEEGVLLESALGRMTIEPLDEGIFRIRFATAGFPLGQESYAIVEGLDLTPPPYNVRESSRWVFIQNETAILSVDKKTAAISLKNGSGTLEVQDLSLGAWNQEGSLWTGLSFRCEDKTSFYGLGEKTGPLDKSGQCLTMWNTDAFGYDTSTDPLYQSHPFVIALTQKGHAVGFFLDSPALSRFDLASKRIPRVSIAHCKPELTFYIIPGPSMKDVVRRYTLLTGRMPMPPIWSIGHMISKLAWNPSQEIPELADRAKKERIPLDALWLDLYYMDSYKIFTWNSSTFPDFPAFLQGLHQKGYRTVGIIHPAIKLDQSYWVYQEGSVLDAFVKRQDGSVYLGRLWPGTSVWPDFTRQDVREWWGGLYEGLIEAGLDGFWNDMNEPSVFNPHTFNNACRTFPPDVVLYDHGQYTPHVQIHNAYGMLMAKASYEGISQLMPGKRPFLLSRAGFSGIQRYAAVWTGDNTSSFEHLSLQNPMLLNLGLSGLAFSGADIGGFAGSATPELLVKWYAASTFMPLMREHADQFATPHEPWAFGEPYTSMIRSLIELRYSLLPYLYAAFYEAHTTGIPVLRPIVMEYPDDPFVRNMSDEFLVGEHLLIAPVLKEKAQGRDVYLPEGVWYELGSRGYHRGGEWVYRSAPLGTLPVFIKEGAVIASVEPELNTLGLLQKPIRLDVYPLKRSLGAESRLVLDDGVSSQGGLRQTFRFIQKASPSGITLSIERSGDPFYRYADFRVHVYGEAPSYIEVDGENVIPSFTEEGFDFFLPVNSRKVKIGLGSNLG